MDKNATTQCDSDKMDKLLSGLADRLKDVSSALSAIRDELKSIAEDPENNVDPKLLEMLNQSEAQYPVFDELKHKLLEKRAAQTHENTPE